MKVREEDIPRLIKQQQNRKVMDHLYKELFPTVKSYIKRNRGIEDDAHDVLQEALLYFYKQVMEDAFDEKYKVYGYVYRLATNRWINKLNKDKKMIFNSEASEFLAHENEFSITDSGEKKEKRNILKEFLSSIGEKCVELLTYRIYSNLMFEDICHRMDFASESAAKMSFNRCRKKMVDTVKSNPSLAAQLKAL